MKVLNNQRLDRIKVAMRIYFYKMALAVCHGTRIVRASTWFPPTSRFTLQSLWSVTHKAQQGLPRVGCAQSRPHSLRGKPWPFWVVRSWHGARAHLSCKMTCSVTSELPRLGVSIPDYPTPKYNSSKIKIDSSGKLWTPYYLISK